MTWLEGRLWPEMTAHHKHDVGLLKSILDLFLYFFTHHLDLNLYFFVAGLTRDWGKRVVVL